MPLGTGEALSYAEKIVHTLKAFEHAVEVIEAARLAESQVLNLTQEGDVIFKDLKILKSNERTARKKIEDWERRAEEFKQGIIDEKAEAKAALHVELTEEKGQCDKKKAEMKNSLGRARNVHKNKMAELEEKEKELQAKVDTLEASLSNLAGQVAKIVPVIASIN